jgi:translation initiation factor 3 subunit F
VLSLYQFFFSWADGNKIVELIAGAENNENRTAAIMTDIGALERAITDVLGMLDRVSDYVARVIVCFHYIFNFDFLVLIRLQKGESPTSTAIGKFLMNTVTLAPKVNAADVERMFNAHIQDVLMVSYLANTIRTQIDLSGRLATYNFGPKDPLASTAAASK